MNAQVELKTCCKKGVKKGDSRRAQFHSNAAPGSKNKRRAGLKKRHNKRAQKNRHAGLTAPGSKNNSFDFLKRAKSTQNIELSSKYRFKKEKKRSKSLQKQEKMKKNMKKVRKSENHDARKHRQACHSGTSGSPQNALL